MFEHWQDKPDPGKMDTAKPVIGLAISVCAFFVSIMVGFYAICGPGSHGDSAPAGPLANVATFFVFASVVSFVLCAVWLIVSLIKNSGKE